MKVLLALLIYTVYLASVDALTLHNTTEWKAVSGFSASNGQQYKIYKPICAGRYKLGDVVVNNNVDLGGNALSNYFVCADGDSSEIVEASIATYVTSGSAAFLNESHLIDSTTYYVQGIVSLDKGTWASVSNSLQGNARALADLRGYGVLVHPKCQLAPCSTTTSVVSASGGPTANLQLFNGLSLLNMPQGQSTPLFLASAGAFSGVTSQCLTLECICPNCVHGTCDPLNSKCTCDPQWRGADCDIDVNECERRTDNCDPIATCQNLSPGFTCVCPSGYNTTDGGVTCNDIDECSYSFYSQQCLSDNRLCVNYIGGYQCSNCTAGQIFSNGICTDVSQVFTCGNGVLNSDEECDRGSGCSSQCTCNSGFTPQNSTDCLPNCGNGLFDDEEECDGGLGCLANCICDENLGFKSINSTACEAVVFVETDACSRFSSGCDECIGFNCFYCESSMQCATNRIASDCLATCPVNVTDPLIQAPVAQVIDPAASEDGAALVRTVVPVVVVIVVVVVAGVVALLFLLKRRKKKREQSKRATISLSRMNSRRSTNNTSKYGLERQTINSCPDKNWLAPVESEFLDMSDMPLEFSKPIDFNLGNNQFKVGQKYTDIVTLSVKEKKSTTSGGLQFALFPPTTKKLTIEFNPASGVIKKGKPVEIEVTMTMNMTTELDIDIGVECTSEKKHSFFTLHLLSEMSSFLDLDEIVLQGGTSAKPVGDGAFGVVYKGKYRGQDVAVKMLKVQDMPEEMLDEFDREVDLMNKLRHKNIVQFIGASKVVGRFALVTEFIEGGNVSKYVLKASKVSYGFKLRVALDTARAMHFLHENRVLHRDLKLDNLLCVSTDPDDPVCAKLTDFGTSRAVAEKVSNQYTVGIGTPLYMAPEILNKQPYDTKCDVYSYGVTLWVLYCQKEPYQQIEHSWEVARLVIDGNREKIPKDCPQEYRELIEQCWAQDPAERPEFQEIVMRLEEMIENSAKMLSASKSPKTPRFNRSRKKSVF